MPDIYLLQIQDLKNHTLIYGCFHCFIGTVFTFLEICTILFTFFILFTFRVTSVSFETWKFKAEEETQKSINFKILVFMDLTKLLSPQ